MAYTYAQFETGAPRQIMAALGPIFLESKANCPTLGPQVCSGAVSRPELVARLKVASSMVRSAGRGKHYRAKPEPSSPLALTGA
jgi:hypothetical protein